LVIDKPAGWTSHQVVGRIRRLLGTRKVGHAGTLDPMATGVLVVGVNRATRLLGHLSLTDKTYHATIRLGSSTTSDDAEGEVISHADASGTTDAAIEERLTRLRGPISQVPSAVSAIKVAGVRSYARVRGGEDVVLAARPVLVHRFEVTRRRKVGDQIDLDVVVECSTGTYVRALARDLGAALGTGGHLIALRRTRVGPFSVSEAQHLSEGPGPCLQLIGMADVARRIFPTRTVDDQEADAVRHGRPLDAMTLPAEQTALFDRNGVFLALYRRTAAGAKAESVFDPPQGTERARGRSD
jgi:tRNA pseudouridine55 synthase